MELARPSEEDPRCQCHRAGDKRPVNRGRAAKSAVSGSTGPANNVFKTCLARNDRVGDQRQINAYCGKGTILCVRKPKIIWRTFTLGSVGIGRERLSVSSLRALFFFGGLGRAPYSCCLFHAAPFRCWKDSAAYNGTAPNKTSEYQSTATGSSS